MEGSYWVLPKPAKGYPTGHEQLWSTTLGWRMTNPNKELWEKGDFTRIAASDPTMWRDVFLNNKEAVLEMLGTFNEDLSKLTRAIRRNDGEALFEHFTRTRAIRRGIVERLAATKDWT